MTTLSCIQMAVVDALRNHHARRGNDVAVLRADAANLVEDRKDAFARQRLAVIVGTASFAPTSRDSGTIVGNARLSVTVYEQPTRNRVGQPVRGPTATDEAEAVACALHLLPYDGGVIVFTGIGDLQRVDEATVSRSVSFETVATLTGE